MDYDLNTLSEFFDKEDKEKTVHWSYIDGDQPKEKDMLIHYMMIEGERFEFPFGLRMKEFFIMNDGTLFPLLGDEWEENGYSFSVCIRPRQARIKNGKSYWILWN